MVLKEFNIQSWDEPISNEVQLKAIESLEQGKVLYFPFLTFALLDSQRGLLSPEHVDPKRKNISYDLKKDQMGGTLSTGQTMENLKEMLKRYALVSTRFLQHLLPHYAPHLMVNKTSFRPVEIAARNHSSVRKDDRRLHVDAFPSNPTRGKRILRMFTNIHPENRARVWRIGAPFEEVVSRFACKVPPPILGSSSLLKLLKITKEKRAAYDHYMLHIHNKMKEDSDYQQNVAHTEVHFPAGSSWIVFTDQASHAALSGQHVLEQTFSLPNLGLQQASSSPLAILEKFLDRSLI